MFSVALFLLDFDVSRSKKNSRKPSQSHIFGISRRTFDRVHVIEVRYWVVFEVADDLSLEFVDAW
jgi:hypothetical protein